MTNVTLLGCECRTGYGTLYRMKGDSGYAKCADCGHYEYRHDRIVRLPDGSRKHWGCLHNWRRAGEKNFRTVCQCERFVKKTGPDPQVAG